MVQTSFNKIIIFFAMSLLCQWGLLISNASGSEDIPLGKIEFISPVRGEILIRTGSPDPSSLIFPGNTLYIEIKGSRITFKVTEISGIYIRCRIDSAFEDSLKNVSEDMVVYDYTSLNSRAKYYDVKAVLRRLINLYENFIFDVESTENPILIAEAMGKFSRGLEDLLPDMVLMNRKYPELKSFGRIPPGELASESALLRKIEPRLKDIFYKIAEYSGDEEVKRGMADLQKVLEKMIKVQ